MSLKFDIDKFTETNDFGLWKVNMRVVLVHNKCAEALNDRAVSAITLCLGDNVLREDALEINAAAMWAKLDLLYMTDDAEFIAILG
jgi:hypothetical protein